MSDNTQRGYTAAHRILEGKGAWFAVLATVAILIGGLVEIGPMFTAKAGPETLPGVHPLSALEVGGRDIYIREGCYTCHSQMIRPMRAEVLRYGEWSRAGEYAYDHPFLLGSRRIGPDLQRLGGKYPDAWHYEHMRDPRSTSPGSIMPPYDWLFRQTYDPVDIQASLRALARVGVPYTDAEISGAPAAMQSQATEIVARLKQAGIEAGSDREIIALIAYLQRLGKDGKAAIAASRADPASQGPGAMSTFFKQAAESVSLGWLMGVTTIGFMAAFGFWIWWAMSSRNRTRWEADSRLPLNDGEES